MSQSSLDKKTQPIPEELNCLRAFVSTRVRDEIRERHQRRHLQLRNALRRNCEVHTLSPRDLQRCDSDHLSLHVYYRAAAGAGRNRRRDLNDAAKRWNVAHGRDDSIRDTAFESQRIADDDYALAFLRRSLVERQGLICVAGVSIFNKAMSPSASTASTPLTGNTAPDDE